MAHKICSRFRNSAQYRTLFHTRFFFPTETQLKDFLLQTLRNDFFKPNVHTNSTHIRSRFLAHFSSTHPDFIHPHVISTHHLYARLTLNSLRTAGPTLLSIHYEREWLRSYRDARRQRPDFSGCKLVRHGSLYAI